MTYHISLKSAIDRYFLSAKFDDGKEKLATKIILYKYLESMLTVSNERLNDAEALVNSYASQFTSKFTDTKNKYISYDKIMNYLDGIDETMLTELDDTDIETVYTYYCNKTAYVPFSAESFSPQMYGIDDISDNDMETLKSIHLSVMAPLDKYFNALYGTAETDMKIKSADSIPDNIGKVILFSINGIYPEKVYAGIRTSALSGLVNGCEVEYPYIKLTM